MKKEQQAYLSIALCAFLWSTGGLVVKLVTMPALPLAALRSFFAAITIWIVIKKPHFTFSKAQIASAICYSATMILFVIANKLTTAANSILLQYTAPVYVAIFGWILLKERIHWDNIVALLCVFAGMLLFFKDQLGAGSTLGNYVALGSGVTFGLFTVFLRMQKDGSTIESMLLSHIITFVVGLPFIIQLPSVPDTNNWLGLLFLGVIQTGAASLLFSRGIRSVSAIIAILIVVIEPLLNPVWVFLITGEKPGIWSIIGGCIIIVAVTGSSLISANRNKGMNKE